MRPTRDALLGLAETALAHAGPHAQVRVVHERSLTSRFARSAPTQATAIDDFTVEIACVVEGHVAATSTNLSDADSLRAAAQRALAAAEAAARASSEPGEHPGLPAAAPARPHDGYDAATAQLDPQDAGRALSSIFAATAEHGLEAFGIWTAGEVSTALVSTGGAHAFDAVTDAQIRVTCRDERGRSGFAARMATASSALDASAVAHASAAKIVAAEPIALAPGEYPVVLDVDAVATLLDMLGELAFDGMAYAEGRGALSGRLGTRVAASCINLADAPRYARTIARAFDAEGVPKAPLALIQDGVAHSVVHDSTSAARAGGGARSTGHALALGGEGGHPFPTNLVLVGGGAADEHELAAPIERGLYVTRLWYVNSVRERETLLTGTTRDGTFLIEDGRISTPVKDVRFTDSALRILASTEALTAESRLVGEGELYGRRFAYGCVCPALRAHGFRVTGAAG